MRDTEHELKRLERLAQMVRTYLGRNKATIAEGLTLGSMIIVESLRGITNGNRRRQEWEGAQEAVMKELIRLDQVSEIKH